jgi:transcriptional antiterminator
MLPTKYLSIKEVADILGVSIKTVYKYKDETPGHLTYGSVHLFDADEFYKGLKERATKKTIKRKGYENPHNL